jgi:predicted nucleic acid binding AN1-type Zn finger protein
MRRNESASIQLDVIDLISVSRKRFCAQKRLRENHDNQYNQRSICF